MSSRKSSLRIRFKGGAGSGHHGHAGRPGKRGGSAPGKGGSSSAKGGEWGAMDIKERFSKWNSMSEKERLAAGKATTAISKLQRERLAFAGDHPTGGTMDEAIDERLGQIGDFITEDASGNISTHMKQLASDLKELGADDEDIRALVMDATDVLVLQENETLTRQLGDHGVRHILSNADLANRIADLHPAEDAPEQRVATMLACVYHDTGYLTDPAQSFLDGNHPQWSKQHYDANVSGMVTSVLGKEWDSRISGAIEQHADTDVDWNDPFSTSIELADNLSLFHREKLPGVFHHVPSNIDTLFDYAEGKTSLDEARSIMRTNISKSGLSAPVRSALNQAVDEIGERTPKYTLGMLAGELKEVEWRKDHLHISMTRNFQTERLQNMLDMGQRQFGKFAETYGIDPKTFEEYKSFTIGKGDTTVLSADVIVEKMLRAIIRARFKGGAGSGHHGHAGRPGKRGGSAPAGVGGTIAPGKDVAESQRIAKQCQAVPKECYKNSAMAVSLVPDSSYVEGHYVIDFGGFQFPVEHGWLEKPDGTVIDPTLPTDKGTYVRAKAWTGEQLHELIFSAGEVTLPLTDRNDEDWKKSAIVAYNLIGVDIEKQLPIGEESKRALIKARMNIFFDQSDMLAEDMYTGKISLGQWQEEMKSLIRGAHTSAASIGKGGWDQMTWRDWGRLGTPMREQYRYLQGFSEFVAENRDKLSLKAIQARARLYGEGAGVSVTLTQAGADLEEALPYLPRDGSTECLNRCHCKWVLSVVDTMPDGRKVVQATWVLGMAEHCPDCVERNGHVEVVTVSADAEVPSVIGGI